MRADEKTAHLPVIVVTDSDLESDRQAAVSIGIDGYLHKSRGLDRLRKNLKCVLKRWHDDQKS